jgi:hypothetical protein
MHCVSIYIYIYIIYIYILILQLVCMCMPVRNILLLRYAKRVKFRNIVKLLITSKLAKIPEREREQKYL